MKSVIPIILVLALVSGFTQAQSYNPYEGAQAELDAKRELKAAAEERKLRMELMEEQRQALRDQRRTMESQQIRNEIQTLEMLGPQSGQGLGGYGYRGY